MPSLSPNAKTQITQLIEVVVSKYIRRATTRPNSNSGNPFVMALVSDFEPILHNLHGMKTSLGSQMEKIAEIIAKDAWGVNNVSRKVSRSMPIPTNVLSTIDSIVNGLANTTTLSQYYHEKDLVLDACSTPSSTVSTITSEIDIILKDPQRGEDIWCLRATNEIRDEWRNFKRERGCALWEWAEYGSGGTDYYHPTWTTTNEI